MIDNVLINAAHEKKTLRKVLEKFTFDDFAKISEDWLKSARFVWFVNGNFEKNTAIKMVEKARELFNVKPVDKEDLVDIRCIALPSGVTHLLEIPLEDKTNENSCLVTHFEVGLEGFDLRTKLINDVVMQYLDEPTFNQLRTIEQLGYVVFSRSSTYRDIMGT
jgi:insulysin